MATIAERSWLIFTPQQPYPQCTIKHNTQYVRGAIHRLLGSLMYFFLLQSYDEVSEIIEMNIYYIALTSNKKQVMIWMISHDVEGFVARQPLSHGILFTSNNHTVRVPRHQSVHHVIQHWQLRPELNKISHCMSC